MGVRFREILELGGRGPRLRSKLSISYGFLSIVSVILKDLLAFNGG